MTAAHPAAATYPGPAGLDAPGRAIIAVLRRNGRASFAAVGRAVGLSERTVRERVHRLISAGAIRITAVPGSRCAGGDRRAVMGIRCGADAAQAVEILSAMPELHWIAETAGAFGLLTEAACSDDGHLLKLIATIRSLPQVTGVEAFIELRQCLPRWPLPRPVETFCSGGNS